MQPRTGTLAGHRVIAGNASAAQRGAKAAALTDVSGRLLIETDHVSTGITEPRGDFGQIRAVDHDVDKATFQRQIVLDGKPLRSEPQGQSAAPTVRDRRG